jgi:hypothetical protein
MFLKMAVFWVVAPCSLVEVNQRFRGPCCLHHQGDEYAARVETVRDIGMNQPRQKPWADQWVTDSYVPNRFHMHGLLIALIMEAARTSETLVNFYQTTRRYNPEDSHLRAHRRENLKSYYHVFVERKITWQLREICI